MKLQTRLIKSGSFFCAVAFCASALTVQAAPPEVHVRVGVRPPVMRVEHAPAAWGGHVWTHGYWGWNGREHVWFDGHWELERPGFRYIDASWVLVGGVWEFAPGYWQPIVPVAPVVVAQPAPVIVQQPQPVYIEKPQSVESPNQFDPHFWYYCRNPAGYYPYVKDCSGGWQQVTPTTP